jgi:hypothetical protein
LSGGSLTSYKIKKQTIVARSSTEYRAMTHTTCKLLWLNYLLLELTIFELGPIELMCGYQLKLYLSSNPFFMRTKHIEVDCHFIREKIISSIIKTSPVSSNN